MVSSFTNTIGWPSVIAIILGSGVLAACLSSVVDLFLVNKAGEKERYEKLYGPLKFHLMTMKLLVTNREEVFKDIKQWGNVEFRIELMQTHGSPLTKKWIEHRDKIRGLFEQYPGLIKKEDFEIVTDFIDGCLKREITEEGKNVLATDLIRIDKLLQAVTSLQNRLL